MPKLTISMAIFNSYVKLPEGIMGIINGSYPYIYIIYREYIIIAGNI